MTEIFPRKIVAFTVVGLQTALQNRWDAHALYIQGPLTCKAF
jgi:hypothetical protein